MKTEEKEIKKNQTEEKQPKAVKKSSYLKKIHQYRTCEYIERREGDSNPRYALLRTAV